MKKFLINDAANILIDYKLPIFSKYLNFDVILCFQFNTFSLYKVNKLAIDLTKNLWEFYWFVCNHFVSKHFLVHHNLDQG